MGKSHLQNVFKCNNATIMLNLIRAFEDVIRHLLISILYFSEFGTHHIFLFQSESFLESLLECLQA